MLIAPSHASISLDQQLTRKSIQLLDKLAASVQLEEFTNLQGIIRELNQGATKAVDDARLQLAREAEANNFINDPTLTNADNMAEDIGFPIFADLEGDEAIAAADMTWDEMFGQDLASHMIIDEVNFA
jgi:ATP-dependent Clp protease ATP-binding subunit ClpA